MAIFDVSKLIDATILDFKNFISTVGVVTRIKLRHRTKFSGARSNRCWEWRFFDFSKLAALRHLGFVMRVLGPPTKGIWWSLSLCKI